MTTNTEKLSRILVIDDNEAIHKDFQKIFSSKHDDFGLDELDAEFFGEPEKKADTQNWELNCVSQGELGYELLKERVAENNTFDVAFVDMRMPPGWDGVETIEHLWKVDPDLQIVICTAFSDHSWQDITTRLKQTDQLLILKKPFDEIEVVQLANSLTQKRNLLEVSRGRMDELEKIVEERTATLKKAHDESENLLSAIQSLLIDVDADGKIKRWNQSAAEIFGIRDDQAIDCRMVDLEIDWDKSAVEKLIGERASGENCRDELAFQDTSGVARILGVRSFPIHRDGSWQGSLLLGREITDQKSLEVQLRQAQKLEAVGQLAAGVAHEINTPMQYVGDNVAFLKKGFERVDALLEHAETLLASAKSEHPDLVSQIEDKSPLDKLNKFRRQIPGAIEDAADGVTHVSRIVRAMKEFSHPGVEDKTPVDINHSLETTITVAGNELKSVAQVTTDFSEDLSPIEGYPGELNQVFLNLIVNAAHAIADRQASGEAGMGTVHVATKPMDNGVHISISDTGGGIPPQIQSRIFDPFFTTKEVGKGTGQGLHIAHTVVTQKHQGQIEFECEDGVGTTFHIRLPLQQIDPSDSDSSSESVEQESDCETDTTLV